MLQISPQNSHFYLKKNLYSYQIITYNFFCHVCVLCQIYEYFSKNLQFLLNFHKNVAFYLFLVLKNNEFLSIKICKPLHPIHYVFPLSKKKNLLIFFLLHFHKTSIFNNLCDAWST